jgi:serine/threonine protein phosphatase PrpC
MRLDKFGCLVIVSDGITNCFEPEKIVSIVEKAMNNATESTNFSQIIVSQVKREGRALYDNLTAVTVLAEEIPRVTTG